MTKLVYSMICVQSTINFTFDVAIHKQERNDSIDLVNINYEKLVPTKTWSAINTYTMFDILINQTQRKYNSQEKNHISYKYNIHAVDEYHAPQKQCITLFGKMDIKIPIQWNERKGRKISIAV